MLRRCLVSCVMLLIGANLATAQGPRSHGGARPGLGPFFVPWYQTYCRPPCNPYNPGYGYGGYGLNYPGYYGLGLGLGGAGYGALGLAAGYPLGFGYPAGLGLYPPVDPYL